jgi:hypothetical protein
MRDCTDAKAGEGFITMPTDLDMRGKALDQIREELKGFAPRHLARANCRMMGQFSRVTA